MADAANRSGLGSGSDGERLGWLILQDQKLNMHALLAQLVEQLTLNQRAQGSSPWKRTKAATVQRNMDSGFFIREQINILQEDRLGPAMF